MGWFLIFVILGCWWGILFIKSKPTRDYKKLNAQINILGNPIGKSYIEIIGILGQPNYEESRGDGIKGVSWEKTSNKGKTTGIDCYFENEICTNYSINKAKMDIYA